ncbi:hypothetical protein [Candidimonas sp. SYP-B2681]|uniref:hypothetical protein n=1 Tax=Candidimonas sp. SYP-B2681 TaxID=2497686 RepID=UPI00131597E3|nr:hypothetical protein [Candidimonas sp. SYP-B2681]
MNDALTDFLPYLERELHLKVNISTVDDIAQTWIKQIGVALASARFWFYYSPY